MGQDRMIVATDLLHNLFEWYSTGNQLIIKGH